MSSAAKKRPALALFGGKKVRLKPFSAHPVLGKEELRQVRDVLKSGILSGFLASPGEPFLGGPKVRELERRFCRYFEIQYAVAVNSATAGLHAALAAAGVGPGDEVIVTPYTMSASASAIVMTGGIPVFADIQEDIFGLDPECVRKKITKYTRAIVVVHLFGQAADMSGLKTLARRYRLALIEDCAQSPAATYKGRYVGTIGTAGVFSFNQQKTMTTGEGGMIMTNDARIAEKARLIRNHGEVVVGKMKMNDIVNMLGWNYRMTELEAAVGIAQFDKLEYLTEYRIELADTLRDGLKKAGLPGLELPLIRPGNRHVYFSFPIKLKAETAGFSRGIFVKAVRAEGIPLGEGYVRPIYFEPMYQKKTALGRQGYPFRPPYYKGRVDYSPGICPVAEKMHAEALITTGLCRYPLKKSDIKDIVRAFCKVYENKKELSSNKTVHYEYLV